MALILDGTNGLFGDVTGGDISGNFIIDSVNLQDGSVTQSKIAPIIATGSTTARSLANRFADVVNVKDFGAVGDGVTDDTAAIQAAIGGGYKIVYLPSGTYKISSTINISNPETFLRGDGYNTRIVSISPTQDILKFSPATDLSNNLYWCGASNMVIWQSLSSPYIGTRTGAGILASRCEWSNFTNLIIRGCPEGIICEAGQCNTFDGVHLWPIGTGVTLPADSSQFTFRGKLINGTYRHCNNHKLVNFTATTDSNGSYNHCIKVESADGIIIANGNVAHSTVSQVLIKVAPPTGVTSGLVPYIGPLKFSNIYFDSSENINGPNYNFYVPQNTIGSHRRIYSVAIDNCTLANSKKTGFFAEEPIFDLVINASNIQGHRESGIYLTNDNSIDPGRANFAKTSITGSSFYFNNAANNSSFSEIDFGYQYGITIAGNIFGEVRTVGIRARGNSETITITGNTLTNTSDTNFDDFVRESGFFVSQPYVFTGNASNSVNSGASLVGSRVGNKINSDVSTIDWYEETTITPTISFGGSSTGVTYSSNQGFVTRIGNLVAFTLRLVLTSKGSSTGTIAIDGLTHNTVNLPASACAISITNINSTITQQIIAEVAYDGVALERKIYLYKIVSGSRVALTDADLTNNSIISITGNFRT